MTILHLGVIDVAYANEKHPVNAPRIERAQKPTKSGQPRKIRAKKHGPWREGEKVHSGEQSTGDVATWIEDKYHLMEAFFALNAEAIKTKISESAKDAMEARLMGAPVGNEYGDAEQWIETEFRKFLDSGAIEGIGIPGVPTAAALAGVNHRLKIKKGGRRPSFIDTGLFQSSFKAWFDNA